MGEGNVVQPQWLDKLSNCTVEAAVDDLCNSVATNIDVSEQSMQVTEAVNLTDRELEKNPSLKPQHDSSGQPNGIAATT